MHTRPAVRLVACSLVAACTQPISDTPPAPAPQPVTQGPTTQPPVAARVAPRAPRSFRFDESALEARPAAIESPVSLTASDGTGLALVALEASAVVEDPLAFTELHLTFQNPEDRVIEGQFRITLPPGASVSRFAMRIGEKWQEGEVVELQAARRAYEDFLHRRQDPALLEQAAGNEFSARVFPIGARERKEIVLSYAQELVGAEDPYRLPLRGLPELGDLSIRVRVGGELIEEHHDRYVPIKDFVAEVRRPATRMGIVSARPRVEGAPSDETELAVIRVAPPVDGEPDEIGSLLVLVDTSASRALGFDDQAHALERLIGALNAGAGPDAPVLIAAFDQSVEVIHEGTAAGFDAEARARLARRGAFGASDLAGALRWASERSGVRYARAVVISDGVVTAGKLEGDALGEAARALAKIGVERIDAVVLGGIRDEDKLRRVVTAGLARDGAVIDGQDGVQIVASKLTRAVRSAIPVAVEGAAWWWPRSLSAVQAGDHALVYAEIESGKPLRVTVGGEAIDVAVDSLARTERPLVERAAARARIASLIEERDAASESKRREELKQRIVDLSTRMRVMSPFTALIVLETEADYARFQIDRNALADILTIGPQGVTVIRRSADSVVVRPSTKTRGKKSDSTKSKQDPGLARDLDGKDDAEAFNGSGEGEVPVEEAEKVAGVSGTVSLDGNLEDPFGGATGATVDAPGPTTGGRVFADETIARGAGAPRQDRPEPRPRPPAEPPPPPPATSPASEPIPEPAPRPIDDSLSHEEGRMGRREPPAVEAQKREQKNPYTGTFADVMRLVRGKKLDDALNRALAWRAEAPGDVMALIALGEVLEKRGEPAFAARAYGSLIDLFPQRADLRRFAGERLERVNDAAALALAADSYARAVEQRPDHPASHRLHAFALLKLGKHEAAFAAVEAGLARTYPEGRFASAGEILAEDLGLVAAAWGKAEPARRKEIRARLRKAGGAVEDGPSLRFVLIWETDANDVDFHIRDGNGDHAFYRKVTLDSGGRLYADVTTGYGPECFTIRSARKERAYPYSLEAHYYSRGPMGYGMGKLQIIDHDGAGTLRFEERPFVIMQDDAYVDLGTVRKM